MSDLAYFERDLAAIAAQVSVVDDDTYQVRGQLFPVAYQQAYTHWHQPLHHFGQNDGDAGQLRASLRQQLTGALYGTYYCTGRTEPGGPAPGATLPPAAEREQYTSQLSAANQTASGYDPQWTVYHLDAYHNAFVTKNGELRPLVAGQWVFANPAETALRVGSVVQLAVTREDTTLQPVFYHVRGRELMPTQPELVRIYFNTDFAGALALTAGITGAFNARQLPFLYKCLNHPDLFVRADSAVLYVSKYDFRLAYRLLQEVLPGVAPHLRAEVPLFTYPLRPGVSFSEDPADGQSFGMSRCQLLAEALLGAYDRQVPPGEGQLAEIVRTLGRHGLSPARIYRNANSHFPYPLPALDHALALA